MMISGTLSASLRRRLFCRSFLLQASWNFEQMQGLGALFVLSPLLRKLYQGEELQQACARHLSYFNTHPFIAPVILSGMAQLEVNGAGKEEIEEFRQLLMAPCAAMGDAFFWGGVRPFAAVVAMFFALHGSLLAPVVLLLIFNLPHLLVRIVGFSKGCELAEGVVDFLARCRLPDLAIRLKQATLILLGILCAGLTHNTLNFAALPWQWGGAIIPLVFTLGWLARHRLSPLLLALLLAALILVLPGLY
ncbi:MAG: PTS system mannose/fructose/sorbose family transporter subunit IID [Desulfuromonadales bacterium]|nr:PTS system mannose/fructose/sorbose family transporter subunit IID [Desulfuromonadales bacterium]